MHNQNLFRVVSLLLALSPLSFAWDWRPLGPQGGLVTAIAVTPNGGAWYAALSDAGLYRSLDGGASWVAISPGNMRWLPTVTLDPTNPSVIYVGGDGSGVFRSSDGGSSWNAIGLPGRTVTAIAVDPTNPSRIFAGTGCNWGCSIEGLYRTEDGGATWTEVNAGLPAGVPINALLARADGSIFAGSAGAYRSLDHGQTWQQVGGSNMNQQILCFLNPSGSPSTIYAGSAHGGMYRSTDGGASWVLINHGLEGQVPGVNTAVPAMAADPAMPLRIYAGVNTLGVYRSDDGGNNWYPATTGFTNPLIRALTADPAHSGVLLAGTYGYGIRRTTTGGALWTVSNSGLNGMEVMSLAAGPGNPPAIYAGTFGSGILRSRNGGGTWDAPQYPWPCPGPAMALLVNRRNPQVILAGVSSWDSGVCRSADGGATWTPKVLGGTAVPGIPQSVSGLAMSAGASGPIYAAADSGIWKSADEGLTWMAAGLSGIVSTTVAVHPTDSNVVYAGTLDARIFKTADGGLTWNQVASAGAGTIRGIAISPPNPALVLAGGEGLGVLRSADGGASWTQITSAIAYGIAFQPWSPQTVYAGGYSAGVFRSTDSGLTWQPINQSAELPNHDVRTLVLAPDAPMLFVGTGTFLNDPMGVYAAAIDDGTFDNQPPRIDGIIANPSVLWPANHKLVRVNLSVTAVDNMPGPISCQIQAVTSNEPDNGLGDGDTAGDIQNISGLTVSLRAERSGGGKGRVYTIAVRCADSIGNASVGTTTVVVPKSQGGK